MTRELPIFREEYAGIIEEFLHKINFSRPPATEDDLSLQHSVLSYFESQEEWDPCLLKKTLRVAELSCTGLAKVYPFVSRDAKIFYGIFSTYMFVIDDSDDQLNVELREFETALIWGKPQRSPFLRSMLQFLEEGTGSCFGRYSSTMIFKSMIEFISGRLIEVRYNNKLRPALGALSFPRYLRQKAGVAEPFAHFAFPQSLYPEEKYLDQFILILPDASDFVSYVNDVLSFYKETIISNEDVNYICNLATVQGVSTSTALKQTCDQAIDSANNMRTVLSSNPQLLHTTERWIQGYIAWYLDQSRYGLQDLGFGVA